MASKVAKINLDQVRPERIEDEVAPLELAATVEELDAWSERRFAVVNEVLTNWVADAISRPNDREGLIALQSAIERILYAPASKAAGMTDLDRKASANYANRWKGFSDAIAARDIVLAERAPERVRSLAHVRQIEEELQAGPIKQSELKAGGLSASRRSQVLSLMEAHGMIHRCSEGKEKWVSLAATANQSPPAINGSAATQAAAPAHRGASYLTLLKAA